MLLEFMVAGEEYAFSELFNLFLDLLPLFLLQVRFEVIKSSVLFKNFASAFNQFLELILVFQEYFFFFFYSLIVIHLKSVS